MHILIIGGSGAFGSFYAKQFHEYGFDVSITDHGRPEAKEFSEKYSIPIYNEEDYSKFDVIIISVQNEKAVEVVKKIAPLLSKGTLLLDFCSVKSEVVKELISLKKSGLELASIHPMHGPRVPSIEGVPVVCIKIVPGEKFLLIQKFFESKGANFFFSTAKEHDTTLAVVQGLTHYSQFVSAGVIKELGVNVKETMRFGSPNYSLFLSLMSRVVLQNPELYSQIQFSNPYNKKMRKIFVKKAKEIEKICNKADSNELTKMIIEEAKLFKEPEASLIESDRAANVFSYALSVLKNNMGKKFLVENMVTHSFHYGIIKEVNNNELVLLEGHNEKKMSLLKLRITTKKEMREWKKKHLAQRHLDYSFLAPKICNTKSILNAVSFVKESSFEIIDEFSGKNLPAGKKSVTIRASFFEDEDKKAIDEKIRSVLTGLGFIFR